MISVDARDDVLPIYRGTAIERLLQYHNLGEPLPAGTGHAELLVGMCMDNRADLRIPDGFAYIIRAAGGNLRGSEFEISYAVGVARVSAIAVLAHTDCGMTNVTAKRDEFIRGLVEWGGSDADEARRHFDKRAAEYQIGDPVAFIVREAQRLRQFYPRILVAPLLYSVEDHRLSQIA